jgi:hypothetical protein
MTQDDHGIISHESLEDTHNQIEQWATGNEACQVMTEKASTEEAHISYGTVSARIMI